MIRRIGQSFFGAVSVWLAVAVIDPWAGFHPLGILVVALVAAVSQSPFPRGRQSVAAAAAGVCLALGLALPIVQLWAAAWLLSAAAAAGLASIAVLPILALADRTHPSPRADRWLWARYPLTTAFAVVGLWATAGGTLALAAVSVPFAVLTCALFAHIVGADRRQVLTAAAITTVILAIAFGGTAGSPEIAVRVCLAGAVMCAWIFARPIVATAGSARLLSLVSADVSTSPVGASSNMAPGLEPPSTVDASVGGTL